MDRHLASDLPQYQSLPLSAKVRIAQNRIRQWYEYWDGNVYVSFSGGKDSTVLLNLVRQMYADVPAVYVDTGLEYPEIRRFALEHKNVTMVRPKMRFDEIIKKYGYPLISKEVAKVIVESRPVYVNGANKWSERQRSRLLGNTMYNGEKSAYNCSKYYRIATELPVLISYQCCAMMKKHPAAKYEKESGNKSYLGIMAQESRQRRTQWITHGCNAYDIKRPNSKPLSVWTEQDVLQYILENNLQVCSVYGDIVYKDEDGMEYDAKTGIGCGELYFTKCQRTGCIFCGFGAHNEKESRFVRLKETHPKQYDYCIGGGEWVDNPKYIPDAPEFDGEWKNWNPKKIWAPNTAGLGMGRVFDMANDLMGYEWIKY